LGDEQSANLLTDSLMNAASEISRRLGQEKADEFLDTILAETESGFTENRLTGAICGFFNEFTPKARQDTSLAVELMELSHVFNKGLDIFIDEEKLPEKISYGGLSLAVAMNNFFSTGYTVAEDGKSVTAKGFHYAVAGGSHSFNRVDVKYEKPPENEGFDWQNRREGAGWHGWLENGPNGAGEYLFLTTGDNLTVNNIIDSGNEGEFLKAANYLKASIGNERAASFLETLTAESNVLDSIHATISMVAMENGADQAMEYVRYLNGGMKSAINSASAKGLDFLGWTFQTPEGKVAHRPPSVLDSPNGGLTLGNGGVPEILKKGHSTVDYFWINQTGVGIGPPPIDLTKLYNTL
jgi:hypothetical protein